MSKFWAVQDSSDSENESLPEQQVNKQAPSGGGRFAGNYSESDTESEDEVRVVKSATDRVLDSIREKCQKVATCRKTNNWSLLLDEFDAVNKMVELKKTVLSKTGLPKFYVKMLTDVEDHVNSALKDKETLKKMKESLQRDINRMKLAVKKHNVKYESEIKDCREHPENYVEIKVESSDDESDDDSDDDEDEEDESEDEEGSDEDDDSDDDSLNDDDESDSDSDSDDGQQLKGRARWLKSTSLKPEKDKVKLLVVPKVRKEVKTADPAMQAAAAAAKRSIFLSSDDDMKEDAFNKKLAELLAQRGRKGMDPRDLLLKLEVLAKIAQKFGSRKEIQLMMHLVSATYDTNRVIDDYMDLNQWRTCARSLLRVTKLLESHASLLLGVTSADDVADGIISPAMKKKTADGDEDVVPVDDGKGPLKVVGTLEAFVQRLHDEYTKSLQQINPHTQEYVTRLSDEAVLIDLAEAVFHYYVRAHDPRAAAAVALLQSEHIYYKHSTVSAAVQRSHAFNQVWGKYSDIHPASTGRAVKVQTAFNASTIHPASVSGPPTVEFTVVDYEEKLSFLCQFIFKHGDERTKTRALLFSVYNHSLHDRYYIARDLFLMSHIQDNIDKVEASTQILYNRTLVTLGLCAFRHGFIQKAHDCLAGICAGRIKDLLAQGSVFKHYDRDPEQEKLERRRQMPYHLHINPELLEAVHMICAMILELPHLSKPGSTQFVSKPFRKYFQGYSRQVFNGPPESVRDHVLLATKSILAGEWQTGRDVLLQLEVWKLVPGDGAAKIREVLLTKVKEEAIKSYLLTYGQYYESIGIAYVAEIFETDAATVKRIASRLIFGKDLSAALDQQANLITLYTVESSSLQSLTQQLTEKVVLLVESNERLIDPILNVYNFNPKDEWRGGERKHDQTDRRRFQSGFRAARPVGGRGYNGSRNSKAGRGATGPQKSVWGKGKPGIKSQ